MFQLSRFDTLTKGKSFSINTLKTESILVPILEESKLLDQESKVLSSLDKMMENLKTLRSEYYGNREPTYMKPGLALKRLNLENERERRKSKYIEKVRML